MSASALLQALAVGSIVAWSAVFAAQRLLPVTARRAQARLAGVFDRPWLPARLRRAARTLRPDSTLGSSCATGCAECGGCAAAVARPRAGPETAPIAPHRRPRA